MLIVAFTTHMWIIRKIQETALPLPPSPDIGPAVAFDIALGKKLKGKAVEFDDKAYVEHLREQGLVRYGADAGWVL
jgi:hypothetical protein